MFKQALSFLSQPAGMVISALVVAANAARTATRAAEPSGWMTWTLWQHPAARNQAQDVNVILCLCSRLRGANGWRGPHQSWLTVMMISSCGAVMEWTLKPSSFSCINSTGGHSDVADGSKFTLSIKNYSEMNERSQRGRFYFLCEDLSLNQLVPLVSRASRLSQSHGLPSVD